MMLEKSISIGCNVVLCFKRGYQMRNRKKQRKLKKSQNEEKLDTINSFGKVDLTPFLAVNSIIKKQY